MSISEKNFRLEQHKGDEGHKAPSLRYYRVVAATAEEWRRLREGSFLAPGLHHQLQNLELASGVVTVEEQVLVRLNVPELGDEGELHWNRVDVVLREGVLLTVEPQELPLVARALRRFERLDHRSGPDRLLEALAEEWVESFEVIRACVAQELSTMEEPGALSAHVVDEAVANIRKILVALQRGMAPAREGLERLSGGDIPAVGEVARAGLQAARGRLEKLDADVELVRERLRVTKEKLEEHSSKLGAESPEIIDVAAVIGERRLRRLTLAHALTAFIGGLAVSFGAVAMSWTAGPWMEALGPERAHLLGALVFPVGFVILIVGRGELFTENFFVPVTGVMTGRGTVRELLQLWGSTLAFNLLGVLLFALLASRPGVLADGARSFLVHLGEEKVSASLGASFMKAVFAGWLMTVLTWLLLAARGMGAQLFIIWVMGFLIVAGHFNHVVISAAEIFVAMALGAHVTVGAWLRANFLPALLGNLVGGLFFVTLLGYVQAHSLRRSEKALKESITRRNARPRPSGPRKPQEA